MPMIGDNYFFKKYVMNQRKREMLVWRDIVMHNNIKNRKYKKDTNFAVLGNK
jgi:hypothetical protein